MSKNSLLDDLIAGSAPLKVCGIGKIRNGMTPEEQAALDDAFVKIREKNASPRSVQISGYTYKWLTDLLKRHEHDVTIRMVEKHSRKMCSCDVH
jgi:hypothetical protein